MLGPINHPRQTISFSVLLAIGVILLIPETIYASCSLNCDQGYHCRWNVTAREYGCYECCFPPNVDGSEVANTRHCASGLQSCTDSIWILSCPCDEYNADWLKNTYVNSQLGTGTCFKVENHLNDNCPAGTFTTVTSTTGRSTSTASTHTSTVGRPPSTAATPSYTAGRPTFTAGRPTSTAGAPTSAAGNPTSTAGRPAFTSSRRTSKEGTPIFTAGRSTSMAGRPTSTAGRTTSTAERRISISTASTHASTVGRPPSTAATPLYTAGRPTSTAGTPTSAAGNPTSAGGRPASTSSRPTSKEITPKSTAGRSTSVAGGPTFTSGGTSSTAERRASIKDTSQQTQSPSLTLKGSKTRTTPSKPTPLKNVLTGSKARTTPSKPISLNETNGQTQSFLPKRQWLIFLLILDVVVISFAGLVIVSIYRKKNGKYEVDQASKEKISRSAYTTSTKSSAVTEGARWAQRQDTSEHTATLE